MANLAQLKAKGEKLAQDLAQVQEEITVTRARLEQAAAAPDRPGGVPAEKIAGALIVLEAREKSLVAVIAANKREQEQRAALLNSKEYKQAQKKIVEDEAYFSQEAGAVREQIAGLFDRLTDDLQKFDEYRALLREYGGELEPVARDAKLSSRDFVYLRDIYVILTQRRNFEEHLAASDRRSAEYAKARSTPKPQPAPVIATVKRTFYRHTNHDGTPALDAAGEPIG